jgi:hypothetical protein
MVSFTLARNAELFLSSSAIKVMRACVLTLTPMLLLIDMFFIYLKTVSIPSLDYESKHSGYQFLLCAFSRLLLLFIGIYTNESSHKKISWEFRGSFFIRKTLMQFNYTFCL